MWTRHLAAELGVTVDYPVRLHCDNAGVVKQASKQINHTVAKHFRVAQAVVRQQCDERHVEVVHLPSAKDYTDILTKALARTAFEYHRAQLMGPQAASK